MAKPDFWRVGWGNLRNTVVWSVKTYTMKKKGTQPVALRQEHVGMIFPMIGLVLFVGRRKVFLN